MPSLLDRIERVPTSSLHLYPGNPRRGHLPSIVASLTENQQYAPLVVQASTRRVLKGNNTLRAARMLAWPEVDIVLVDVDDHQARKILLADNRTSDLASYDDDALLDLLSDLDGDYAGTGWTEPDVAAMLTPPADDPDPGPAAGDLTVITVRVTEQTRDLFYDLTIDHAATDDSTRFTVLVGMAAGHHASSSHERTSQQ